METTRPYAQATKPVNYVSEMRPAIKDLLQLPDELLFEEVAKGVRCVIKNAESLAASSLRLNAIGEHRSAAILHAIATEESAKVLILIDLIRCPRCNQEGKRRTVRAFARHLAKEIYAASCDWRMSSFAAFTEAVNFMRCRFYLAGPNDVDWIVPNHGQREGMIYVDYVQDVTVEDGDRHWMSPPHDGFYSGSIGEPRSLLVARALDQVGITTRDGLALVAELWRSFEPNSHTGSHELFELIQQTLIGVTTNPEHRKVDPDDARMIHEYWPFPMWSLDLKRVQEPSIAKLRRERGAVIEDFIKRNAERDPPPTIGRSQLTVLCQAYDDCFVQSEQMSAAPPHDADTRSKRTPRSTDSAEYKRLIQMVRALRPDEVMDLATLGWFGARRHMGWKECHEHARYIHARNRFPDSKVDYVCSYGRYWMKGMDRWEQPPEVPKSFTMGSI